MLSVANLIVSTSGFLGEKYRQWHRQFYLQNAGKLQGLKIDLTFEFSIYPNDVITK